jgi:hypothetical protein
VAQQVHDAVEGAGTDENAVFGALAGRTQEEIDRIAAAYLRMHGRAMIDDLRDDLSDGELRRLATLSPAFAPEGAAGPGGAAGVAAQLRDAMEVLGTNEEAVPAALSNRSPAEILAIKAAYLGLTGRHLEADLRDELSGDELQRALAQLGIAQTVTETDTQLDVPIEIQVLEDEANPHKVVDVTNDERREHVILDVNVSKATSDTTIAHEFGHVLGLCDEYDGGIENLMFWHQNRADDPAGIMNDGTEHRARYFESLRLRVQAVAPPGCVYHVVRTR